MNDILLVPEVAKKLRVSEQTVRRFVREGRLEASRTTPGGKGTLLVRASAIDKFMRESEQE